MTKFFFLLLSLVFFFISFSFYFVADTNAQVCNGFFTCRRQQSAVCFPAGCIQGVDCDHCDITYETHTESCAPHAAPGTCFNDYNLTCTQVGYSEIISENCHLGVPTPTPIPDPCGGLPRSYCNGGASPFFCCGSGQFCSPNNPGNGNFTCSGAPPSTPTPTPFLAPCTGGICASVRPDTSYFNDSTGDAWCQANVSGNYYCWKSGPTPPASPTPSPTPSFCTPNTQTSLICTNPSAGTCQYSTCNAQGTGYTQTNLSGSACISVCGVTPTPPGACPSNREYTIVCGCCPLGTYCDAGIGACVVPPPGEPTNTPPVSAPTVYVPPNPNGYPAPTLTRVCTNPSTPATIQISWEGGTSEGWNFLYIADVPVPYTFESLAAVGAFYAAHPFGYVQVSPTEGGGGITNSSEMHYAFCSAATPCTQTGGIWHTPQYVLTSGKTYYVDLGVLPLSGPPSLYSPHASISYDASCATAQPVCSTTFSGSIIVNPASTNCASLGGSAYSGAGQVSAYNGTSPASQQVAVSSGSYGSLSYGPTCGSSSFLTLLGVPYTVTGVCDNGVYSSQNGYTYPYTNTVLASVARTVTFLVSSQGPWYQVDSGDVRFPSLTDPIPGGLSASVTGSSLFASSTGTVSLGAGVLSPATNWQINQEYSYNSDFQNGLGSMSYTFYLSRAKQRNITINTVTTPLNLTTTASGVYQTNGDLSVSGNVTGGKHIVLLVGGNTIVTSNISVPTGSSNLFVLASKGNIVFNQAVGTSPATSTTASVEGYYTSEGNILLSGLNNCGSGTDLRLNVGGALVANSLHPFAGSGQGKIIVNRNICAGSSANPTYYVKPRPDLLLQMTDFYKIPYKTFQEVNP